jgi:hypothetical protein
VGTLHKIILDPLENVPKCKRENGMILLKYLPICLLVKFDSNIHFKHEDFEENVFPIFPQSRTHNHPKVLKGKSKNDKHFFKVKRTGFPMTLNFSSTAHKCQGETLQSAVIDLNITYQVTTTSSYVPLSRLTSSSGLYILRDFPDSVLQKEISPDLSVFMKIAEKYNDETRIKYDFLRVH